MKKLKLLLVVVFSGAMTATYAQTMSNDDTLIKMQRVINYAEAENQEVVRVEADLIRTEQSTVRELQNGYTYTIVGVGSDRIDDLEISLYKYINNNWVFIKKDTNVSSSAAVTVTPTKTGYYKVVITANRFKSGYDVGHYGLIVYHNNI